MRPKDQLGLFQGAVPAVGRPAEPPRRPESKPARPPGGEVRSSKQAPPAAGPHLSPSEPGPDSYLFPPPSPPEPRQRAELPFGRRMSELLRRLQLMERDAKSELGLTLPQAHALHALADSGSLRMQELAEVLGLAQSTVTRLVLPLKRMGLLDRRPDRADGRATRSFLTERGNRMVDGLERTDGALYDAILARLPDTRRGEVVAAIELLQQAVDEMAQTPRQVEEPQA